MPVAMVWEEMGPNDSTRLSDGWPVPDEEEKEGNVGPRAWLLFPCVMLLMKSTMDIGIAETTVVFFF